ncbi:MAG: ThuA domain-containing protein [Thermoguttaceae bacterium]
MPTNSHYLLAKSHAIALCAAALLAAGLPGGRAAAEGPWVVYEGADGPGKGKHVVLVSGDEEYRSEEALVQLGRILARRHGFKCTVLFAIDPKDGTINPVVTNNIPGLEALRSADLMIIATRYRNLPDDQMRHIVEYLDAGRPVLGMRTATHAFKIPPGKTYSKYSCDSKDPAYGGGFGRQVLGETWINHHGHHGFESTRGVIAPDAARDPIPHPIVRGCDDIWCPTDVYQVRLPLPGDSKPLLLGQVLTGMKPGDPPVAGPKNDPMMPVAWTKAYAGAAGRKGRVFTTTMGAAVDLGNPGVRRLLVNAAYWCVGLEDKIPPAADVALVGKYEPSWFGFGKQKKGVRPADLALEGERSE